MLVLSRKSGEQIRIGENVILSIVRVRENRVQIGIEAPAEVLIERLELRALPHSETTGWPPVAEFDSVRLV